MLADRILYPCAANACSRENQRLKWAEYRNADAASASSKIGLPVVRDCGGFKRREFAGPGTRVQRPQAGST